MEGWLSCSAAAPPGKGRRGTQLRPSGSPSSWRQTEFKQGQLFFFSQLSSPPVSPAPFLPSFLFALEVSFSPFPFPSPSSRRLIFQFCFLENCKQGPTALSLAF